MVSFNVSLCELHVYNVDHAQTQSSNDGEHVLHALIFMLGRSDTIIHTHTYIHMLAFIIHMHFYILFIFTHTFMGKYIDTTL